MLQTELGTEKSRLKIAEESLVPFGKTAFVITFSARGYNWAGNICGRQIVYVGIWNLLVGLPRFPAGVERFKFVTPAPLPVNAPVKFQFGGGLANCSNTNEPS